MSGSPWIEVDREGLAQIVADRPPSFILFELIQNALDEPGVTTITVDVRPDGHGKHQIVVQDDAPDGYHDLRHAWTLFAPSKKKSDPTRRGRFNSGCKTVLALLIHELAHEKESDHLSRRYYDELCRIGACLALSQEDLTDAGD